MSDTAHQEKHFEAYVVSRLAEQGWKVGQQTITTPSVRYIQTT